MHTKELDPVVEVEGDLDVLDGGAVADAGEASVFASTASCICSVTRRTSAATGPSSSTSTAII